MPNGAPIGLKNVTKSETKTTLETKSTKHVEHVLNLTPLDLQETRFRMEWLPKITKTRSADEYKHIKESCRNEANIHETSVSELNKKRSLTTEPQQSKNTPIMTPKWIQQE